MMYYYCERCNRAIKKPYPSKKYCSVGCRENSRQLRVEEQEIQFWNSIKPLVVTADEQQVLDQMDPAPRAGLVIERMAPSGAVGYRVGCRRIGRRLAVAFGPAPLQAGRLTARGNGPGPRACFRPDFI